MCSLECKDLKFHIQIISAIYTYFKNRCLVKDIKSLKEGEDTGFNHKDCTKARKMGVEIY